MSLRSKASRIAVSATLFLTSLAGAGEAVATATTKRERIPVVPRTLVVRGSEPGYIDVRLSRRVVVDTSLWFRRADGPNARTRISGKGPFTGVAIAAVNDTPGIDDGTLVVLGQFRGCTYGCDQSRRVNYTYPFRDRTKLSPGVYRVYFMAGGAARVKLKFLGGRRGKLVVVPGNAIRFDVAVPTAVSSSTAHSVSAGADYELTSEGIRFSILDVALSDGGSSSTFGTCLYPRQADTPEEVSFQPGCPEGTAAGRQVYPVSPQAPRFYYQDFEFLYDPATWAFGSWHQSSVPVQSIVHGSVFLSG